MFAACPSLFFAHIFFCLCTSYKIKPKKCAKKKKIKIIKSYYIIGIENVDIWGIGVLPFINTRNDIHSLEMEVNSMHM